MAMDAKAFLEALEEIEISKGISKQTVLTALEEALKRVYTKFLGGASVNDESLKPIDVRVAIDTDKGTIDMWQVINVVEEVEDDLVEISPEDAKEQDPLHKDYKVGDEFEYKNLTVEVIDATDFTVEKVKVIVHKTEEDE